MTTPTTPAGRATPPMTYKIAFTGTQGGMTERQLWAYKIAFTGTQGGMTERQLWAAREYLFSLNHHITRTASHIRITAHHGCCVGADEEFHFICRGLGLYIVGHPPVNTAKISWRAYEDCDSLWEPKDYLDRNRDVVEDSIEVLVAPKEPHEILRSGTWSTYRYAKKIGVTPVVLLP